MEKQRIHINAPHLPDWYRDCPIGWHGACSYVGTTDPAPLSPLKGENPTRNSSPFRVVRWAGALCLLGALILLSSCCGSQESDALHHVADSLIAAGRSDSAITLLQTCDSEVPHWPRRRQMHHELLRARAMNKAYIIFTTDSVMKQTAEWYDRHGTPNEQMEAHYLLGCTYRDMGEAPRAIATYNAAIDRADTTDTDCDYGILARIYAQMADIFYRQNLTDDCLESLNASIRNAVKVQDTAAVINSMAYKMAAFDREGRYDSVVAICDRLYREAVVGLGMSSVSRYFGMAVKSYLMTGLTEKADTLLKAYEHLSGYFDEDGQIERGREAYYSLKGKYYMATGKPDSAEACFREELRQGSDFLNQNMAAHGLAILYQSRSKADSAAKYALYSYDMNDSLYRHMATQEVEQVKGMYDYSRHQERAMKEEKRARITGQENMRLRIIVASILALSVLIIAYIWQKKRKAQEDVRRYTKRLQETDDDIRELQTHESGLRRFISELEKTGKLREAEMATLRERADSMAITIAKKEELNGILKAELTRLRDGKAALLTGADPKRKLLESSPVFKRLHSAAYKGNRLAEEQWLQTCAFAERELPQFHAFMQSKKYVLSDKEYMLCIFLRLYVSPTSAGHLIGVTPSAVTKLSKSVLAKIFQQEGSTKELRKALIEEG